MSGSNSVLGPIEAQRKWVRLGEEKQRSDTQFSGSMPGNGASAVCFDEVQRLFTSFLFFQYFKKRWLFL